MTDKFAAFKVPLVSADELRTVKERGEDISYDEAGEEKKKAPANRGCGEKRGII